MTAEQRCPLCGDTAHSDPDTEDWMGLYCPSVNASEQEQQAFRSALAKTWAEVFDQEVRAFFEWEDGRPARNAAWDSRQRADGVSATELPAMARRSEALQADCSERTDAEITRQKRDEVFQPFGEFEIEVPHLTVKGEAPRQRGLFGFFRRGTKAEPEDALLYVDPSQDVP